MLPFLSRSPRVLATMLACTLGAAVAACDSPNEVDTPVASQLVVVSGDGQEATVGTELPGALVVRVTDDRGTPVPGQVVSFRVASGAGSVFAGTAQTDEQGEARERWTLGTSTATADSQRVEVRAVDASGAAQVLAVFRAVARPGAPAQITAVGATDRTATVGVAVTPPPSVRVSDRFGNPVPGQTVAWAVTDGGGSVSPASITTDASGVVSAQWTLGTSAGAGQALRATVGQLNVQFTATTTSGAAATLSKVAGDGGISNANTGRVVQVRLADAFGNPVAGQTVTWTVESGGGRFVQASTVTDALGYATTDWILGGPGVQTARASVSSGPAVVFTATAAARLIRTSTPPTQRTVGSNQLVGVRVVGPDGRGIEGIKLQFTVVSGGGSVSATAPETSVSFETAQGGFAVLQWVLGTRPGTNTLRVSATAGVTESPQDFTVATVVGPAARLRFRTQPSDVRSGQIMTPPVEVEVLDQFGNLVPTQANPVGIFSDGIEGGVASAPVVNGVATFSNLRGKAGVTTPQIYGLQAGTTSTYTFYQSGNLFTVSP